MIASFMKLVCVSRKLVVTQTLQTKFVVSNSSQNLFINSRNFVLCAVIRSSFVVSNDWMAASSNFEKMRKIAFVTNCMAVSHNVPKELYKTALKSNR